jgi:hypothetical protein
MRAGVALWPKSYHQMPVGSLPEHDVELCHLAELGRDIKAWKKIKAKAMHGWKLCSDGRLYHETVAEKVLQAWHRFAYSLFTFWRPPTPRPRPHSATAARPKGGSALTTVRTNTSAQIRSRISFSDGSTTLTINTRG